MFNPSYGVPKSMKARALEEIRQAATGILIRAYWRKPLTDWIGFHLKLDKQGELVTGKNRSKNNSETPSQVAKDPMVRETAL